MWKCNECGESNFYTRAVEKTFLYGCSFDKDGNFEDCCEEEEEDYQEVVCVECKNKGCCVEDIAEWVE